MSGRLLVGAAELAAMIEADECIVFDCRYDLQHPDAGRNSWLAAHIPGAAYAHLDKDLSGPVTSRSGRHPLPRERSFAAFLSRSGWREGRMTVAYDAHGGAYAARLWWLMRYFGLGRAALLDGGIGAWMAAALPMESGEVGQRRSSAPVLTPRPELVAAADDVSAGLAGGTLELIDARDAHRFEGQSEPIDTVAGHIPGAVNHPYARNLTDDRYFRAPAKLAADFRKVTRGTAGEAIVHMCGSGVTACQNIFAMELAGISGTRLYAGSWSEWIRDPARPVALGPD